MMRHTVVFICAFFALAANAAPVCQNYVGEGGYYPPEDALCSCAASQNCIGKCCPSTGKCAAASCDGNKLNQGGHEKQCVVGPQGTNQGAQCPFSGNTWGVVCTYVANCQIGKNNNCYGYTTCNKGSCPSSAVGVFCLESGNSDNFKVCGCDASPPVCNNPITGCDFYVNSFNKKLVVSAKNGVLSNDKDAIKTELVQTTQYGILEFNSDGSFVYSPKKDFCGTDTFTYVALNECDKKEEEVVITTTCGCGEETQIVQCKLDKENPTTDCVLPGGKILTVASIPGYSRARIRINAKVTYKV
jgi:hypothetical protein